MKISGGLTENGIITGNTYDKYNSRNHIVKWLMSHFESNLSDLVDMVRPAKIHEIGCGEGYLTLKWIESGIDARGSDFSNTIISIAQENAVDSGYSQDIFKQRSIYELEPYDDTANLVVCCEVLEHIEDLEAGLRALQSISDPYLIVSVPNEPLWSILNMMRGKYWRDLGNTPGHIQKWSRGEFIELVSNYFYVEKIRSPIPWTMLLCRRKK